ncbi:MAG: hypothetical protein IT158_01490 [Bryobacterales bacterium]|nr:hypothetical protein [Bryobacterales bacterium]
MRFLAAFLIGAALLAQAPLPGGSPAYVQAVAFPFEQFPQNLWERELVWLKNLGIRTVAFPANLGQNDLDRVIKLLRRLDMHAWIRPPWPAGAGSDLTPHLLQHGGPIAFVEGGPANLHGPPPPAPVAVISAVSPGALARSRQAIGSGRGSLLWTDVEDSVYPVFRKGVVSMSGEDRPGAAALRRNAALLRNWAPLIPALQPLRSFAVRPPAGKLPAQVSAVQLSSRGVNGISAVNLINQGTAAFKGSLRVFDPRAKAAIVAPGIEAGPGQSLWLPVDVPLAYGGLCRDCSSFARRDRLVFATAELHSLEFENGILAMEFAAPSAAEAVLELTNAPSGPFVAGGTLSEFQWDEKTARARLPIPAGKGPGHRVRIGLAIEPPEHTGFFVNPNRLILGRKNRVPTSYSSEELAGRSRLLVPPGYQVEAERTSPAEIVYQVTPAAGAAHGEFVELALEADGVRLGRARLQLFRPVSLRLREAARLHFGTDTELPVDPPLVWLDPRAGRNLDIVLRNNMPSIENFVVEASGEGLEFLPPKYEISAGAVAERSVAPRVFAGELATGVHQARLTVSGAARMELPFRVVAIRRNEALAYSLDLDSDGSPEWVLENQRLRAVFSARGGGRWLEFVWKDTNLNVLPESGVFPGTEPVGFTLSNAGREARLEIAGAGWRRTVRLGGADSHLTVEQDKPLPPETLRSAKRGDLFFGAARPGPARAIYYLERGSGERFEELKRGR